MSNDIQVTVTHDDFEKITEVDKKLNLIYRVVSAQQTHCKATVERLDNKIDKIERPQINKVKGGAVVGGATGFGATLGFLLDKILNYLTQ